MKRIKSTIDMMNMVVDKRITETPEFTGQFMVFPNSFGSENEAQKSLSRMSREQLAAFLNAESGNAQSAHFVTPPAEPPPPTPEKGLAIGVLKQAAYDLRRLPDGYESRRSGSLSRRSQLGDGIRFFLAVFVHECL